MFSSIDVLKSALGKFFKNDHYEVAVSNLRIAVRQQDYYKNQWTDVVLLVLSRNIGESLVQELVEEYANIPLHTNTDDEAYRWLTLVLINAAGPDGSPIIDYKDYPPIKLVNES